MRKRSAIGAKGALVICVLAAGPALAADLDGPAPTVIAGIGPRPVYAIARSLPANCRLIHVPRFNLSRDDVVGAQPQVICFSRGLLADSFER
jgi:hypothetical protein